jgi:hypothetical protein
VPGAAAVGHGRCDLGPLDEAVAGRKPDGLPRLAGGVRFPAFLPAAAAAAALLLLAGCFGGPSPGKADAAMAACRGAPAVEHVLYFGPSLSLQPEPQPPGSAPGNAFSSAFLTNDLKEWLSAPVGDGLWLVGNVTLEYWVRNTGTPAPIVLGGDPGEGYHFFNQFGSDRTLQPAYAVEYSDVLPAAGAVDHYVEALQMPPGGFVLEPGDRVRVLLTDLAADGMDGSGHEVLFGGGTPSQVRFSARCWPDLVYSESQVTQEPVSLPGNQGLLTGAVPPGPHNQHRFQVQVPEGADRIRFDLRQESDRNPVKDDIDLQLLDRAGAPAWSIGSPYSDESGTLWADNLRAVFPDGAITVQVDSYSGFAYQGHVTVTAAWAVGR